MRAFWTGEPVGCALPLESGRKGRLLRPFATETRSDPVVESRTGDRRRSGFWKGVIYVSSRCSP